jgi:hypothetical protein
MMLKSKFSRATGVVRARSQIYIIVCMSGVLATIIFCGCGRRGPERVVVSGSVTYNGKPIPEGTVRFLPPQSSSMPATTAIIKDGAYQASGLGGVAVGTYKIEIEAFRQAPEQKASPMVRDIPRVQYLPKRFNADSKMEITIEPGSTAITKDFTLTP